MRYSDDTRRPVTGVRRVGSSARPWTQRDMSSFPVVVRDPLGQDTPETLAPGRADEAFTMSVRLRSSHRCDQCLQRHRTKGRRPQLVRSRYRSRERRTDARWLLKTRDDVLDEETREAAVPIEKSIRRPMTLVLKTRPYRQHVKSQEHARPRVVECSMRHR